EVVSARGSEDEVHSEGRLIVGELGAASRRVDIAAIAARCSTVVGREEVYAVMERHGMEYGESFRAVEEVRGNGREALARIEMPSSVLGEAAAYVLLPSVVDAALQAVVGLDLGGGAGAWMPMAAKRVTIHDRVGERMYAHARGGGVGGNAVVDIDLVT